MAPRRRREVSAGPGSPLAAAQPAECPDPGGRWAPATPPGPASHHGAGPGVLVGGAEAPQLEAASVPSAQQVAAEVADESEPAGAAASDVTELQPGAAQQEDAAVQARAAVRSGAREPQAAARLVAAAV